MFVHLPIVLAMLGIPLTLLAAIFTRNLTMRWMAISLYVLLVIAAFVTVNSGDKAHDFIDRIYTPEAYQVIEDHDSMATKVWLFAAGTLMLLGLSVTKRKGLTTIASWLAVLASIATVAWVGSTANLGGNLVYKYGIGTPNPLNCDQAPGVHIDGRDHAAEHASNSSSQPAATSQTSISNASAFQQQVWPILSDNCTKCHNPSRVADGKSGRLDQTTRDGMLKGGKSGPAIVPGKPEDSLLVTLIKSNDPDERMPPDPRAPLTASQIAAIEQWIREGAVWPADVQ
jgi:uncharacterized membrane protein